ncbi:MAG TPA: thioredoxin family protein [Ferruginibacter sp.]|jgi:thioredoxin-related protein|nr:thioredoxin family protein [Ferruginibacter sp.]
MKNLLIIFSLASLSFTNWETDFEKAKQLAKEKHELILLNFSGSDWCGPCIRMKKELFADRSFIAMADQELVLVNADFPRNKKNQPGAELKKQNEQLADKYDPEGKFPFTLLLNADGKVLKTWDGLPAGDTENFIRQIKDICHANK